MRRIAAPLVILPSAPLRLDRSSVTPVKQCPMRNESCMTDLDSAGQPDCSRSNWLLFTSSATKVGWKVSRDGSKAIGDRRIKRCCNGCDGQRGAASCEADIDSRIELVGDGIGIIEDVIEPTPSLSEPDSQVGGQLTSR